MYTHLFIYGWNKQRTHLILSVEKKEKTFDEN